LDTRIFCLRYSEHVDRHAVVMRALRVSIEAFIRFLGLPPSQNGLSGREIAWTPLGNPAVVGTCTGRVLGVIVASVPANCGNVAVPAVWTRNAITAFGPVLARWAIIVGRLGYPVSRRDGLDHNGSNLSFGKSLSAASLRRSVLGMGWNREKPRPLSRI
jgi:hypothetical protein